MRDTFLQWTYSDGTTSGWEPVSKMRTSELVRHLELMSAGEHEVSPDSPNGGKPIEQTRERILIELRAR